MTIAQASKTTYTHAPYGRESWPQVTGYFTKFNTNREGRRGYCASNAYTMCNNADNEKLVTQGQQLMNVEGLRGVMGLGVAVGHPQNVVRDLSPAGGLAFQPLLGNCRVGGKHCLVLDLDETLVHSSFKQIKGADTVLKVEIDSKQYKVFVCLRPYVREFIQIVSELFETVVFTASLGKYAGPVLDYLDPKHSLGPATHRLYREHCTFTNGAYIKDLVLLGRPLHKICIIDNSPVAYLFQPSNALPCPSWFGDQRDDALPSYIPLLQRMAGCDSVYEVLDPYNAALAG